LIALISLLPKLLASPAPSQRHNKSLNTGLAIRSRSLFNTGCSQPVKQTLGHMETINKSEAARRHLDEAIKLFFECRDSLVIHTIAAAAQGILRDIAKATGAERLSILHDYPGIPEDRRRDWINILNTPRNFFKHADRDPDGILQFDESNNIITLLDAVLLYRTVSGEHLSSAKVFIGWFTTKHPEMRNAISGNQIGEYAVRNKISPEDKATFLALINAKLLIESARV
jgi:hypothetical protein